MPRLFAALEISHKAASALSLLRGGLTGARWIDPDHYHITLRFMGDVEGPVADAIAETLDTVRQPTLDLSLAGLGAFGGKKPRTLFAVPEPSPVLMDLQADIDRRCKRIGLAPDSRKFTPHVTLARLRNTSPGAVANYISLRGGFYMPPDAVTRFVLMSSRDSVGGGPYIVEESYPLGPTDRRSPNVPAHLTGNQPMMR